METVEVDYSITYFHRSRTSSEVELMETWILEALPCAIKSVSRTSSEVELMETSKASNRNFKVEHKSRTSSEVELMETCLQQPVKALQFPSHALLRKWN